MYTPWYFALGFAGLIIVSRLITNRQLATVVHLPSWVSLLYMLGFVGLIVTFFWSIVAIGWWGPIPIVLLYFATSFVRSLVTEAVTNPNVAVVAAMQQAVDELKDMPPGPEKLQKVQHRTAEILGIQQDEIQ